MDLFKVIYSRRTCHGSDAFGIAGNGSYYDR